MNRACAAAAVAEMALAVSSCVGARFTDLSARHLSAAYPPARYPSARFAVFGDPHLYDGDLGTQGAAFQRDMVLGAPRSGF